MPDEQTIEHLREFLEQADLTTKKRRQSEDLLKQAERGDDPALAEVVKQARERGYVPLSGEDIPLPPGPRMVCPVDPAHYQIFRHEAGEELICPEHDVRLVLADDNE